MKAAANFNFPVDIEIHMLYDHRKFRPNPFLKKIANIEGNLIELKEYDIWQWYEEVGEGDVEWVQEKSSFRFGLTCYL